MVDKKDSSELEQIKLEQIKNVLSGLSYKQTKSILDEAFICIENSPVFFPKHCELPKFPAVVEVRLDK